MFLQPVEQIALRLFSGHVALDDVRDYLIGSPLLASRVRK